MRQGTWWCRMEIAARLEAGKKLAEGLIWTRRLTKTNLLDGTLVLRTFVAVVPGVNLRLGIDVALATLWLKPLQGPRKCIPEDRAWLFFSTTEDSYKHLTEYLEPWDQRACYTATTRLVQLSTLGKHVGSHCRRTVPTSLIQTQAISRFLDTEHGVPLTRIPKRSGVDQVCMLCEV